MNVLWDMFFFSSLSFLFDCTQGGKWAHFAPSSGEGILSELGIGTPAAHFLVNLCALKERLRLLFVARSSHHLAYELCSPVYSSCSSPVFQLSAWSLYPVSQSSLLCSSKMCRIHRLHWPVSLLESTLHNYLPLHPTQLQSSGNLPACHTSALPLPILRVQSQSALSNCYAFLFLTIFFYFPAFRNLTCLTAPLINPQSARLLLTSSVL